MASTSIGYGHAFAKKHKATHSKHHKHNPKNTHATKHTKHAKHSKHTKHHKHAMKHHHMHHDFSDVKRWVKIFENPKRTAYQKPKSVVRAMQIKKGMHVADIGAGTGYFLPYLQSAIGTQGALWALDIAQPLVRHMKKRIQKAKWKNAQAKHIQPNDPQLKSASLDRILIANTWHHIGQRIQYGKKILKGLKKKGAVYIVEFTMNSPFGPGKHHRLRPQQVQSELKRAGFTQVRIVPEDLPYHYIVVGIK